MLLLTIWSSGMRWWGPNVKCFSVFSSHDLRLISLIEGNSCTSKRKSGHCFVGLKIFNKADLAKAAKVVVFSFTEVWIINIPSAMTALTSPGIGKLILPLSK